MMKDAAAKPLIEIAALDHVHLYASDTGVAADWYCRVLGLTVLPSSVRLDDGKYMATSRGQYCATIFKGQPPSDGDHTSAFRVNGRTFISFGEALPRTDVIARDGRQLGKSNAVDHKLAWSYYFQDPDGNHLEITTYDHDQIREWFGGDT
ncbi:MAG: VOC family protein [Boseongicola sp.]